MYRHRCSPWGEALACDSFMGQRTITYQSAGGHWRYDGTINLSMLAYTTVVLAKEKTG